MTLALLNDLDVKTSFEGNVIKVYQKQKLKQRNDSGIRLEFILTFSLVALSETASISLSIKKQVCRRFRFGENL
jgi:3-phosphoshikimate 1-carboxyvinyltransferase